MIAVQKTQGSDLVGSRMNKGGCSYSQVCVGTDLEVGYRTRCDEDKKEYSVQGPTTDNNRQEDGCCARLFGCGKGWRVRYVKLISILWALLSGPSSGFFAATCIVRNEESLWYISLTTAGFFFSSMLMLASPTDRWIPRIWLFMGLVWIFCSVWKIITSGFGDDIQNFKNITMISSIVWGITGFVPLFLTDPCCPTGSARRLSG